MRVCAPELCCRGVLASPRRLRIRWVCGRGGSSFPRGWGRVFLVYWCHLGGVCCGVMIAWCPGLVHVQLPGVCSSCRRVVLFAACVVLLALVGGLKFLACARAFGGFLL